MADDVVGDVRVDVHGNTDPLKEDIRRAGRNANDALSQNQNQNTPITDNIVEQVRAAEPLIRVQGRRLGRILGNGIQSGMRDSLNDSNPVWNELRQNLRNIGDEMGKSFADSARDSIERLRRDLLEMTPPAPPPIPPPAPAPPPPNPPGEPDQGGPGGPGPGGPGPGGPGPDHSDDITRQINRGLRRSVSSGILDAFFKMIIGKIGIMGSALSFAIRAAGPLIAGLTTQVMGLGASLGAAGIAGGAAIATMLPGIGALKIAFAGMDAEAKKALNERFAAASGDLAGFKERVRNEIIPALVDATETVSKLAPEINKLGKEAAQTGGHIATMFANMLVGRREEIGNIFENSTKVMDVFGHVGVAAVDTIINALDALQPLVEKITKSFGRGADNLFDTLNEKIDSGQFLDSMTKWYESAESLGRGLKNLGTVIGNVFGAAMGSADTFDKSFEKVTKRWADWTESFEGQNQLKKIFDDAKPVVEEVWGLLGDIAGLFTQSITGDTSGLLDFVKMLREDVIPGIEDFQDMLRESGIQDGLYALADSIGKLFEAGGGQGMAAFLEMLSIFIGLAADLLDAVGPLIGPLLAFGGAMKAIGLAKAGLSGVGAVMSRAITPLMGLLGAGQMARFGALAGAVGGVTGVLGPLAAGFFVARTAAKVFQDRLKDPEGVLKGLVADLKEGKSAVEGLVKVDVPQGWLTTGLSGPKKELNGLAEIIKDLGSSDASMGGLARDLASFGFDLTGVQASTDAMNLAFTAIQEYARNTGDWQGAQDNLNLLTDTLKAGGVQADIYTESLEATRTAIDETATAAGAAGARFTGDFSAGLGKEALNEFGEAFDANITQKIDALYKNQDFIDIKTGGLNPKGMKAREEILQGVKFTTVNTVEDAISDKAGKKIHDVYLDPKMLNKKGTGLNALGIAEVQKIIVEAVPEGAGERKKKQDALKRLWKTEPIPVPTNLIMGGVNKKDIDKLKKDKKWDALHDVAKVALQMYLPETAIGDIDNEIEARFASDVLRRRVELSAQYKDPAYVDRLLADEAKTILIKVSTEEGKQDLLESFGQDYMNTIVGKIDPAVNTEHLFEFQDQLFKLKTDAEGLNSVEVVVGADKTAAEATYKDILELTKGKDGTSANWSAGVAPVVVPAAKTEAELALEALTGPKDVLITPVIQQPVMAPGTSGASSYYLQYSATAVTGGPAVERGAQSVVGAPSMISMGGPTTMGGPDISPVGLRGRAGGGGGDVSSRFKELYTNDKGKQPANVTINNYYPKPERVSDTVAMQMRVARYA